MSTAIASKLLELEARAGASDQDREAWLAERRGGITATEVRDLWLEKIGRKSYTNRRELIDRKLGRIPEVGDLSGVPVIGWGKDREPVIAAEIERRFMIAPESRVFRSTVNPRWLASPDGVGVDFDGELVVSEIKTAGKDIAPGTEAFATKGYLAQMIWVMVVTGARRCLYGHEYRLDLLSVGFQPGLQRFWWIEWDAELAAELIEIADAFLADMDAVAAGEEPDAPAIDEELDTLAVNYLRGLDLEKQAKELKEPAYRSMFELLDAGEPFVQESALARVSFTPAIVEDKPVFELDQVRAKQSAPAGLYERLEQAEDDLRQAQEAFDREQAAVTAHEAAFIVQAGTERVVLKRAALRVTAAKATKGKAA
jgi:predicted phage-related endonuclease